MFSCDNNLPTEDRYFIGTWKTHIKGIDDSYMFIIQLNEHKEWILENEYDSKDHWNFVSDTLILKNYTKSKNLHEGKIHLEQKDMKYVISKRGDNYFDAYPFFGWDSEEKVIMRFERQ